MTPTQINYDDLKSYLTVKPPYYAFNRVYADEQGDGVCGDFIPEQPVDGEYSAISVAEAGRHVAILGTLLGESLSPGNGANYYLALEADVEGISEPIFFSPSHQTMTAQVRCRQNTANRLTIDGLLIYKNKTLLRFVISYVRLNDVQFRYLYRDAAMPTENATTGSVPSPWRHPVPLLMLPELQNEKLSAKINSHDPQLCAGHFDNYPMWPIAIIMSAATQLITTLLRKTYYPQLQYQIISVNMRAKKLLSVSEAIVFHAEIISQESDNVTLFCLMNSNSDAAVEVAELKVSLKIINSKESAMNNFDDNFFLFLARINPDISAVDKDKRTLLVSEFWQDSVDALTVLTEIEKEYGVRVPDSDFGNMKQMTLQGLCDIVRPLAGGTS